MGTLFSSEEQASVDRKSDLADLLILLININESNLRIPLMLAVEILNYAGSLPPIVYQNNAQFRSGNNCDFKYLSVRIPQSRYISPMSLHVIADSKDQGWSSYPNEKGTRTSHTWGELRLSTQPFSRYLVFRNIHAGSTYELHDVSISLSGTGVDEQFILLAEQIRMAVASGVDNSDSDTATLDLVVRSMYPGWNIFIRQASMEVRFQLCGDWDALVERYSNSRRRQYKK